MDQIRVPLSCRAIMAYLPSILRGTAPCPCSRAAPFNVTSGTTGSPQSRSTRTNHPPAVGSIGRVVGFRPSSLNSTKRIFNAIRLRFSDWKDDALAEFFFGIESQLNVVAVCSGYAPANPGARGEARRRINGQAAIGRDGAGSNVSDDTCPRLWRAD